MIWLCVASTPVPPGGVQRICFNHPAQDQASIVQWLQTNNLMTAGVQYALHAIPQNDHSNVVLLATQRKMPVFDATAVAAAQHAPRGQRGQTRPNSEVDRTGFQELGDEALPVAGDGEMFDPNFDEGTVSDLARDGTGQFTEQPRQL